MSGSWQGVNGRKKVENPFPRVLAFDIEKWENY